MDALEEIIRLISKTEIVYKKINDDWLQYVKDKRFEGFLNNNDELRMSLKKNCVKYIKTNPCLYNLIEAYRTFIVDNPLYFETLDVRSRIKTSNSILSKVETYTLMKFEKGEVPIIKCLNDICGIRIEIDDKYTFEEIISAIKEHFPNIKVLDASKYKYKTIQYRAIHVYFMNGNYYFPLELQIWYKKDHFMNMLSHYRHKQTYVNWEDEDFKNDISKKERK